MHLIKHEYEKDDGQVERRDKKSWTIWDEMVDGKHKTLPWLNKDKQSLRGSNVKVDKGVRI